MALTLTNRILPTVDLTVVHHYNSTMYNTIVLGLDMKWELHPVTLIRNES